MTTRKNDSAQPVHAQILAPQDTPYPGTIKLAVDASDTSQGIFRVHATIPVTPGALTLLYPKWIPGFHEPAGPIAKLAGLKMTAKDAPLAWKRDPYEVYAFHVEVPHGAAEIELEYQYLSARGPGEGPLEMTSSMLNLVWNALVLYPAGHYSRGISFQPSVKLPPGWQFGTALETASQSGDTATFKPIALNTLVDSPLYAGRFFKRVDLAPAAQTPVRLNLVADAPKYLELTAPQLQAHQALVTQATRLFGSQHYQHYDFLLSLSDQLGRKGVEHHQSSENGTQAAYFTEWDKQAPERDLLPHEYTHSWNGKFRRPADLWTPNFNVPMGDSLLWLYEGQTQYWGFVLTARAGLWLPEQFRDALALVIAGYDRNRPGFGWRSIQDTTNDPSIAQRAALPYRSWQMSEEYYSAGQLMWLEADAKIRALSKGAKSLDDFARAFFGVNDGSFVTETYVFENIISTLNTVLPFDWEKFLRSRLDAHAPPLQGIETCGWRLVYTDKESEFEKNAQNSRKLANFAFSIGLRLEERDNRVSDVRWDGPAFKAGVSSGSTLVAVNGHAYKPEILKDAIIAAKGQTAPIELLLKNQDEYRNVAVDYHDGLQHPHLERIDGTQDYLSGIIAVRS
ncbi:MAG: M61 family metallopeptidase [Gammaproteobacteria bacterium]|nr:peptidase M61 [Gammaproteobacteria bacterium]MBU6510464.1 peptidase M61 [Gammaproteobacteria bacterium]MDE1984434.1 M61 family metallopeptidase [Gammaproteobacteria bacterium]MDE2109228.1 M61 family metallopeptidase [Gammaproteobacteria bacterium]MDE2461204.1 M61 family metallopeptidase [Gammaproteobacteria bacterium]